MSNQPYVIVPFGMHLIDLIRYNPINVVAALDCRNNGSLQDAGINDITQNIFPIGMEQTWPLFSIAHNSNYYQRLDKLLQKYNKCKFVITGVYTPIWRFIIDRVGVDQIELWEDGLNHYVQMENILPQYQLKEGLKLLAGHYSGGIFNSEYKKDKLFSRDRFVEKNLTYPRPTLKAGASYYIGQPLVENHVTSERKFKRVLTDFFVGKNVTYIAHPREQERAWMHDLFDYQRLSSRAEKHLVDNGASEIYSAFSTVNTNINCDVNQFIANAFGLSRIAESLTKFDFGVDII